MLRASRRFQRLASAVADCLTAGECAPIATGGAAAIDRPFPFGNSNHSIHLTLWPPSSSSSLNLARQYGLAAAAVAQQGSLSDVQGPAQTTAGTDTYLVKVSPRWFSSAAICIVHAYRPTCDVLVGLLKQIVTGNLRGAGTHSPAWIRLIGTNGTSERFKLGEEDTFERASSRLFPLVVPAGSIGQLRRVLVEKRTQTQLGDGWFLKHVEVEGPAGDRTLFPCNAWLGESDCGGFNGEPHLLQGA